MKTKRNVSILVILILCISFCGYFLYQWFQQPVAALPSTELSKQSEVRIEKMKETGEINTNINISKNKAGEVISTECFSTIIPLPFSSLRTSELETNKCLVRAQLSDPRGTFVVHSEYQPNLTSVAETSGAAMRLTNNEYSTIELPKYQTDTLAFKSATEVTIFSYHAPIVITIAFSELGSVDQEIIEAAQSALDSVKVFSVE